MARNMDRRDFLSLVGGSMGMLVIAGCAGKNNADNAGASATAATDGKYTVDYGTSEVYTHEDMDAAIQTIMAEFDTWKGCTMKSVTFAGDQECADNLAYCNELRDADAPEFTEAIVFKSDFHSPSEEEAKGTAWEPDSDYNGYSWVLARTTGEPWQLLTWGYA
ncbi:MAG: hypothetical protein J6D34_07925 [Atopobiaceae bacterium]|nr:hypothetical protein [Atopobiaceae bacterium]